MKAVINWLIQQIKLRAIRSWANSKRIHQRTLKKTEGQARLAIALIVLVIFSWALIPDDPKLGLSFLFAGSMAIYAGYIYKGREVMGYVLAGVILATVIPSFFPGISESYKQADYIGMFILILFGLLIYYLSSQLKKGERPTFEEKKPRKPRPRKRRTT